MILQIEIGIDFETQKVKYHSQLKGQGQDNKEGVWPDKAGHIRHITGLLDVAEKVEAYLDELNKSLDCNKAVKAE